MGYRYIHFAPFTIEIEGCIVRRGSRKLCGPKGKRLMPRAVRILILLIEKRGNVVRTDDLGNLLDQPINEEQKRTDFRRYISYMRSCLGKKLNKYVRTISKKGDLQNKGGYKFIGDVQFTNDPEPIKRNARIQTSQVAESSLPNYDVAFAELVIHSRDPRITAYPGFGWGSTLSLQDAPQYDGWPMSEVELRWKKGDPFELNREKQKEYNRYFRKFYEEKRFRDDNTKFMLELNPIAFSDTTTLVLTARQCKYSQVQFFRDNVANRYEGDVLLDKLIMGSLHAEFPHSLCMHAAVVTADRKLLRTQRSPKVAYYPGAWSCSVEENLTAADFKAKKNMRVLKWGLRLLKEELHVTAQSTSPNKMRVLSVFLESDILNISLCAEITLALSSSQLDTILKGHRRTDYEFTRWNYLELNKDILLKEIMQPSVPYHPTSSYRLVQVFLKHFGTPSEAEIIKFKQIGI
jgi:DNA-binding winged helix-turn-helix (wHTH) protein